VLFENADCVFILLANSEGAVLLPNGVCVVELPNGEGAAEVAESADFAGSLFWFDGFPNGDEVVVFPNGKDVVVVLPKGEGEGVVVVGKDDLVGSLFWFGNPEKLNLGAAVVLVVIDAAGVVEGVDVALELLEFNADAGVVGCLKLKARGVLWDEPF